MIKHHSGSRSMALLFSFFLPTWISFYPFFFFFFFFFFPLAEPCGMRKFPGQASNSCHSSNWSCYSDNAGSLTCCTTVGTPIIVDLLRVVSTPLKIPCALLLYLPALQPSLATIPTFYSFCFLISSFLSFPWYILKFTGSFPLPYLVY